MAYKISTKSFAITAQTDKEALDILLKLLGHDIASFSSPITLKMAIYYDLAPAYM